MKTAKLCAEQEAYIIEMRRWFHRHPEPSLQEEKTSQRIQEELKQMGIPFVVLVPHFSVIATIQGKKPGRKMALRADIDALPVREETGLPYASEQEGLMHACGHDAHIAMMLGAARVLNSLRDEISGTVYCVFQVAEEIGLGHQEVIDHLDAVGGADGMIGLHIWSGLPEGEILLLPKAVFAGCHGFAVELTGQGGHGARPDLVKDPIKAACDLVLKLSAIPGNFYDVLDHSVVSVCKIEAGTAGNIFPSTARINGTMRWFKPGGGEVLIQLVQRLMEGTSLSYGVDCKMTLSAGSPPVYNDPAMVLRARELVQQVPGLCLSAQTEPISASDNFALLLERYPGFYGILGGGILGDRVYPHHHPKFDVAESALRKGTEFMVNYALDFLHTGDEGV